MRVFSLKLHLSIGQHGEGFNQAARLLRAWLGLRKPTPPLFEHDPFRAASDTALFRSRVKKYAE
jgi:hypothetical protein